MIVGCLCGCHGGGLGVLVEVNLGFLEGFLLANHSNHTSLFALLHYALVTSLALFILFSINLFRLLY